MSIENFERQIKEACICQPNDAVFAMTLIAAFAKSAGFVIEQEKFQNQGSFWTAPTLRSICEDLIVLGFIDEHLSTHADEVITLLFRLDFHSSLNAQEDFFQAFRPLQPRIRPKVSKNELKKIKKD
jgi:hypothetical protein